MEYYAGMFDAEGCVSLTPEGSVKIRLNNTWEDVPNLFKEKFGGIVYKEPHRKKKIIYSWYLNSENTNEFCNQMTPRCLVKGMQLQLIFDYRNSTRVIRREIRPDTVHAIASLKKPIQVNKDFFCNPCTIIPDESFYKWLAGFIEGDGSIRLYEQSGAPNVFSTYIGASNTFADPIQHIYQRINGGITRTKQPPHLMWKWCCAEKSAKSLLISLIPHLRVKKNAAELVLEFIKIRETRGWHEPYTHDQINRIRDIISTIKHYNSL